MNLLDVVRGVFADEDGPAEDLGLANATLAMAGGRWYKEFMTWIKRETSQPFPISAHAEMIAQGARINALREVETRVEADIKRAERAIARARER